MTHERDTERLLDLWFADGPTQAPDRVIDVVADRIGRQPQRPGWRLHLEGHPHEDQPQDRRRVRGRARRGRGRLPLSARCLDRLRRSPTPTTPTSLTRPDRSRRTDTPPGPLGRDVLDPVHLDVHSVTGDRAGWMDREPRRQGDSGTRPTSVAFFRVGDVIRGLGTPTPRTRRRPVGCEISERPCALGMA